MGVDKRFEDWMRLPESEDYIPMTEEELTPEEKRFLEAVRDGRITVTQEGVIVLHTAVGDVRFKPKGKKPGKARKR